jgi:hypothetical protein
MVLQTWALAPPRVWVRYGGGVPYKTHTHALCLPCTARASPQPVVHRLAFDWRCSTFEPLGTPRLVQVVFELGKVEVDVNIRDSQN